MYGFVSPGLSVRKSLHGGEDLAVTGVSRVGSSEGLREMARNAYLRNSGMDFLRGGIPGPFSDCECILPQMENKFL